MTARLIDGWVEVAVHDTGIGIAPEGQPRIFEPFRQVRPHTQAREGTGLGLALAREFVELLFAAPANRALLILHGAKPADLPMGVPTDLELVINLQAAAKIGFDIPAAVLAQATDVLR